MKALIVDDEMKSAQYLQNLLADIAPEINVLTLIHDPQEALAYLNTHSIDLLFLDIEMPNLSGLDLLSQISDPSFEVIFVTGYDQYAIEAITFCAIGYILKPVDEDDLKAALVNAQRRLSKQNSLTKNQMLVQNISNVNNKKIGIQTSDGLEFIDLINIIRCEASQRVTKVVEKNRVLISSYNIGHFSKLLEEHNFFKVHKSHLVNISYVSKVSHDGFVIMNDDARIPLARRRKTEFLSLFI